MKLEKKQDEEIARRQGMAKQTVIQIVWFIFSGIISYFLVTFTLNSEEIPLDYNTFYNAFGLSRNTVPEWAILAVLVLVMIIIFQIFLWFGFIVASPEGRRRTGEPSLSSRNRDPFS